MSVLNTPTTRDDTRVERSRPAPHHAERAGPGEAAATFDRGDFVLVAGTHLNSRLIRLGRSCASTGMTAGT